MYTMNDIISNASDAYAEREMAKEKIASLKEQAEREEQEY